LEEPNPGGPRKDLELKKTPKFVGYKGGEKNRTRGEPKNLIGGGITKKKKKQQNKDTGAEEKKKKLSQTRRGG